MRISRLRVHNFRSIRDVDVAVGPLMVLLGPNNHGKSNLLGAVESALQGSIKVQSEDFCAFRSEGDDEVWVELTFSGLTDQERGIFAKYVNAAGLVTIRRSATIRSGTIEAAYHGYVEEPVEWWLKDNAFDRLGTRESLQAVAREVPALRVLVEGSVRITKQSLQEFQHQYIAENRASLKWQPALEDGPLLGTKNVPAGSFPAFHLIPAVRDLTDEIGAKASTAFGRLLQRAVATMIERDPRIAEIRARIAAVVQELNARPASGRGEPSPLGNLEEAIQTAISSWGVEVGIRVNPPAVEQLFDLGAELRVDDGHDTTPERKGHGLQRAILFGLIRAWAAALRADAPTGARPRKVSESVIFAIEEPELFLHPHAQRQLDRALREIAHTPEHQVFIATHSTHFVNLDDYKSIAIVTRDSAKAGTRIRQSANDLFEGQDAAEKKDRFHMAVWINPDRGELFFARKVVLVEGETERVTLPFLAARLGCHEASVSVIDCGSKYNIPLYLKILNAFKMNYTVVHDEDPIPEPPPQEWTPDKLHEKQRTFALNQEIQQLVDPSIGSVEMCVPDYEHVSAVPRRQGERKGKPLAALEHLTDVETGNLPVRLVEIVRRAYSVGTLAKDP